MTRARPSWLIYGAAVLAVFAGLIWLTRQSIALESRERSAREQAALQESIRLALWRMDSAISPIIAQEAARPYFQYRSFYPADRAYNRMWEQIEPGEVLVASPLLSGPGPYILLHFEQAPDGGVSSPQAPDGFSREQAEAGGVGAAQIDAAASRLAELGRALGSRRPLASDAAKDGRESAPPERANSQVAQSADKKSEQEYLARQQTADYARNITEPQILQKSAPAPLSSAAPDRMGGQGVPGDEPAAAREALKDRDASAATALRSGAATGRAERVGDFLLDAPSAADSVAVAPTGFKPLWITGGAGEGPYLLFARRVPVGGEEYVQGFWMDWPAVHSLLTSLVGDLLPGAEVRPMYSETAQMAEMLAAIPAVIVPGATGAPPPPLLTPTRAALALTWAAVIAALAAVGIVLRKSIDLAERRGQFVSAVTHELRTPLTTFCLYTQMLADGMVPTDAGRTEYLGTLRRESLRLARIVENVLEYARLGQRARRRPPAQTAGELVAALAPALLEQASRAGMTLLIDFAPAAGASTPADAATVERILTNLVENSAKYAADAPDRRLHLSLTRRGAALEVRYRDHGPGIPRAEESRIFQPFHRASRDAQGPTPGLGLGLALSRGLAREMGGDLRLVREAGEGAEFLLVLPAR